jgi:hypothetical protein
MQKTIVDGYFSSFAPEELNDPNAEGDFKIASSETPEYFVTHQEFGKVLMPASAEDSDFQQRLEEAMTLVSGETTFTAEPKSKYIRSLMVDSDAIRDHLDHMVTIGLLPPEARVQVYNEMAAGAMGSIGPHIGTVMRHEPRNQSGIHPLVANSVPLEKIPQKVTKNAELIWESLPESEKEAFREKEAFIRTIWLSATDHLFMALTVGNQSSKMSLRRFYTSSPSLLPVPLSENAMPLLSHSLFLSAIESIGLRVMKYESGSTLVVTADFGILSLRKLINIYIPVLSIFSQMVADWYKKNTNLDLKTIKLAVGLTEVFFGGVKNVTVNEELEKLRQEENWKLFDYVPEESFDLLSCGLEEAGKIQL